MSLNKEIDDASSGLGRRGRKLLSYLDMRTTARRHWNNNFDLLMATVEDQDFPVAEGIQRGFSSGAQHDIVFGRNEPALQEFHQALKSALAPAAVDGKN